MNKKIKTILFTLFVAGLLTVSCSSKDKTGPSSDNGDNPTIPTIPETGNGISSGYQKRYFFTGNPDYAEGQVTITSDNQILYTLSSSGDFRLDTQADGSILVKMPKLTELGFTSDLIRIPAKNIAHGAYGYDIHTLYVFSNTDEKIEYVELKAQKIKIATQLEMDEVGITLTKTTKLKDQDAVTETYNIKGKVKNSQSAASVTPIDGTPVDPNY